LGNRFRKIYQILKEPLQIVTKLLHPQIIFYNCEAVCKFKNHRQVQKNILGIGKKYVLSHVACESIQPGSEVFPAICHSIMADELETRVQGCCQRASRAKTLGWRGGRE